MRCERRLRLSRRARDRRTPSETQPAGGPLRDQCLEIELALEYRQAFRRVVRIRDSTSLQRRRAPRRGGRVGAFVRMKSSLNRDAKYAIALNDRVEYIVASRHV